MPSNLLACNLDPKTFERLNIFARWAHISFWFCPRIELCYDDVCLQEDSMVLLKMKTINIVKGPHEFTTLNKPNRKNQAVSNPQKNSLTVIVVKSNSRRTHIIGSRFTDPRSQK
uniref:Uncharacterized protein n=1 Tax=Romanomermis culicivorax TaxID=13658 RepID=A0A915HML6_ROMCU